MEALHAEACITSSNASVVVELLCMQLASLCVSISEDGGNRVLRFDAGRALLRSVGDSLMMRVEADSAAWFADSMARGGFAPWLPR